MSVEPTPARQLARKVIPATVRRVAVDVVRARPASLPPLADMLVDHEPAIAATLARSLVHRDNGEPLHRPVVVRVRDLADLDQVRRNFEALLAIEESRLTGRTP